MRKRMQMAEGRIVCTRMRGSVSVSVWKALSNSVGDTLSKICEFTVVVISFKMD